MVLKIRNCAIDLLILVSLIAIVVLFTKEKVYAASQIKVAPQAIQLSDQRLILNAAANPPDEHSIHWIHLGVAIVLAALCFATAYRKLPHVMRDLLEAITHTVLAILLLVVLFR